MSGFDVTGTQQTVGYDIVQEGGRISIRLVVTAAHANRHNVMHGGFMLLLMDSIMGVTCSHELAPETLTPFMSVTLTGQFHAPAKPGDTILGTATVMRSGRSLQFCNAELRDADGVLLATATGVFKRVNVAGANG